MYVVIVTLVLLLRLLFHAGGLCCEAAEKSVKVEGALQRYHGELSNM